MSLNNIKNIKLVIMDVDGVLTDGQIIISCPSGDDTSTPAVPENNCIETKCFHVHDGTGVKYLHRAGLTSAIITGRKSKVTEIRAKELGIEEVHQGVRNKINAYHKILHKFSLTNDEVCYIGDDLTDIPLLQQVGLSIAVANARPEVKVAADYVTRLPGGNGAVREAVEMILKAQGKWNKIMERYEIGLL